MQSSLHGRPPLDAERLVASGRVERGLEPADVLPHLKETLALRDPSRSGRTRRRSRACHRALTTGQGKVPRSRTGRAGSALGRGGRPVDGAPPQRGWWDRGGGPRPDGGSAQSARVSVSWPAVRLGTQEPVWIGPARRLAGRVTGDAARVLVGRLGHGLAPPAGSRRGAEGRAPRLLRHRASSPYGVSARSVLIVQDICSFALMSPPSKVLEQRPGVTPKELLRSSSRNVWYVTLLR